MSDTTELKLTKAPRPKHELAASRALDFLNGFMKDATRTDDARVHAAEAVLDHARKMQLLSEEGMLLEPINEGEGR